MIPEANKAYVRSAVAILCVVIGVTVSGIARVGMPDSISASSSLRDLPAVVAIYLNLAWVGSGIICAYGILSGRKNVEAAGFTLIASAWASYYVAILAFNIQTAPSAAYVLGFAVGTGLRGYFVASDKYEVLILRKGVVDDRARRR